MTLNKLKEKSAPPTASSILEEEKKRRADRKARLLQSSKSYIEEEMYGSPKPTEDVDFSLDGLNELNDESNFSFDNEEESEGMSCVSSNSTTSNWQNIARQQSSMTQKTATSMPYSNPIVNAAATTYNPLGGSYISQAQQGYNMFGMGMGIGGMQMNNEQAEEIRKAQEAQMQTMKNYWRGTMMWGRPENVSVEDWTKQVEETLRRMFPSQEDLQQMRYEADHKFMDYTYDENFQRVEESGVSVSIMTEDGDEILLTQPNDPETGTHKIVYSKSQDVAEYQSRLHFYDNCRRSEYEKQMARYIFDVVCAPPPEALATSYESILTNGVDDPYMKWVYNTYYLKDYKRHMTRWKAGCYMSPKEYTRSFYLSGIDPNIRFDMNTLPTQLGDRRDVKLAYDYQNHPELFNGPQVEQYLTNKLKVNYEMRKRAFLDKLRTGNCRVDYNAPIRDADPCPPIVGTAPIAPDDNGVIKDIYGKPLFDPTKDLASQLTDEQQDALTEYNINARLAQYKAMGEEV